MSFTIKPSQIFEAGEYAYSVEYSQNGPFSNLSGITRRAYGGATWEDIDEIETYLGTVGDGVNTNTFEVSNHKVYRNGDDIVVSFVTFETFVDYSPYEYRLHIFKSVDGVTFPIHLNHVIKHGQGDVYLTYYRNNAFYNIGNHIYHDRYNYLLKFDESMELVGTVAPFFNLDRAAHSYGNLRYYINVESNASFEIDITDVTDGSRTVQLYPYSDFFTAPNNKFNAAGTRLFELNGQLYMKMDGSLDLPPAIYYVPVTTGGTFFDFANAVRFDGDNIPFLGMQYSDVTEKFYYLKIDSSNNAIVREADTLLAGDDAGWTDYIIPDAGTGLETVLNSGGSFLNFRYHDAWNSYVFACAVSSFDHFYAYDKVTLTNHSGSYNARIMSDGAGFLRKNPYGFQDLAYSTDLVTWTDSDYDHATYGNDANLDYYPEIGYVAAPYGYNSTGVWYSVNGVNWFFALHGGSGGQQVYAAEPNKVRFDTSNQDGSEQQKIITYVTLNPTAYTFEVLASGVHNWFEVLGQPYIARNNVDNVTKLITLRTDLTGVIISSDGDDVLDLDLNDINANYEVRGIAAFYDGGVFKLTAAYFDGTAFKLDILSKFGSTWGVDVTIDISDIYEFATCEFDSDGGPVAVTKAGSYYFVFGKLRNLTRVADGFDEQTMEHFDILLKGTSLNSVAPISIQTIDINSGVWTEIPYETRMELVSGSSLLANFSVKVDGSDVYVGMVENSANEKFFIAKTTAEFEDFTRVGPKVSPFVGGIDEDYFSVTEAGNFLAYGDGKLVLITSDGVRDYLTPNYIDHPEIPGYTFSIWQYYAYGANDRYCLTGTQVDPFSYEEVDYPAAVVLGLYDTEEETNQQFYIKFNELPLTFTGAECALLGSKFVNGAYHLIFNWWDDPSNSIGVEIFNVNLTTGALTSVAYELLSTNPSVDTVTGPTGQYKLENTNLNYFTIADRSVDNAGAYETFHIDDDMVVSLFRSFTFTGAANQWPGVPYVTSGGDMFLQVGDSDNGDLCTVYKVNGTTVELPTTPYTFPDVATKVISISPTRHLFVVIHGWDETTVAVLDENGNLVREVAEQDQYAGFVDPITEDTTKVRFGTGVSNASSTHYIKNIVQYLNDEDVPVYLVIAYQIFHYGEG